MAVLLMEIGSLRNLWYASSFGLKTLSILCSMHEHPLLVCDRIHRGVLSDTAKVIHEYIHVRDGALLDFILM
jgi:hypothetical protein